VPVEPVDADVVDELELVVGSAGSSSEQAAEKKQIASKV
jgi:hypothetical protein